MQGMDASEDDIVHKITESFSVTREYALVLLVLKRS